MGKNDGWQAIEELDVFRSLEELSDEVWSEVAGWKPFERDTLGKQLARAVDSIGANLVEGDGRYHFREKLNYCYIARASAREAAFWLRRAQARGLIGADAGAEYLRRIDAILRWINVLIAERRRWAASVREDRVEYLINPEPIGAPEP